MKEKEKRKQFLKMYLLKATKQIRKNNWRGWEKKYMLEVVKMEKRAATANWRGKRENRGRFVQNTFFYKKRWLLYCLASSPTHDSSSPRVFLPFWGQLTFPEIGAKVAPRLAIRQMRSPLRTLLIIQLTASKQTTIRRSPLRKLIY